MRRTRAQAAWAVPVALVLLAGCAMPIRIESRIDPAYSGSLGRVFVVSRLQEVSARFGEPCEQYIVEELTAAGVETRLLSVDPLALDDTLPVAEAWDFAPEALLVLDPADRGGPKIDMISAARIDITLRNLKTESVYWRARFTVESGSQRTPMGSATGREFAKALVKRLADDGLLGPST